MLWKNEIEIPVRSTTHGSQEVDITKRKRNHKETERIQKPEKYIQTTIDVYEETLKLTQIN